MSLNAENNTNASEKYNVKKFNIYNDRISPEFNEERTRASLEPLKEQIFFLSQ